MYEPFLQRVEADSGHRVEFERSGTLQVALDAAQAAGLRLAARMLKEAGAEHSLIDAAAARQVEPHLSERTAAALLVPAQGYVAATSLVAALAQAALNGGATFSVTPALGIATAAHGVDVTTPDEVISADAVIIAAGSWSSQLNVGADLQVRPSTPPAVKPIRGQLLQLRLDERPASRVIRGPRCYVVPWRDGSVLVGATMEDVGFDERPTAGGMLHLLDAAIELLPALRSARFEEVRAGLRPMTANELPAIGRSSTMPHVFYATGHFRNGVLLAPLTARLIAELVLDGREPPELELVRPDRVGL